MPHLDIPLRLAPSASFGSAGFVAEVILWVCEDPSRQDDLSAYHKLRFRVDTGATHTSMSLELAQQHHVTVPLRTAEASVITVAGAADLRVGAGEVFVKFVGLEGVPLRLPCVFHQGRAARVPSLLGLNSLQPSHGPTVRYTFDGDPSTRFPNGKLTIELLTRKQ